MPVRDNKTRTAIAPSILSADFGRLAEEVAAVTAAGADLVHVDVMDGRFVPNITIGPVVVGAVRRATKLPLDVHLMILEPERHVQAFVDAGADILTVHVETCPHLHRVLGQIRAAGASPAVALNPHTPIQLIEEILDEVEMVLVMSVNPGFGGQPFIDRALTKIEALAERVSMRGLDVDIEVDGGINVANSRAVTSAGATVLVAGSAVFGAASYEQVMKEMRKAVSG